MLMEPASPSKAWLEKNPMLLTIAVYTFLRILEDHEAPPFKNLRQMEIEFCSSILRERFADCIPIGRDLVRLLHNVARIPEFNALWNDILHKPQSLCPQFTGIGQLLYTRTSRKFLASRLHPEMENKILFLTSKVRFGQQKRYQDWFQKQYLSTPESQSRRADLIRYIVGVVHPCNEVLCSDIIPRWAIIGWLLTSCQTAVSTVNAKLALFFDWLFYQPDKDNIMNIEPAILLMHHSARSHPAITSTLMDFLCRIVPNYSNLPDVQVRQGVIKAFRHILSKKVVMSLSPLLDSPKMERDLRNLIRGTLAEFCDSGSKLEESSTSAFSKVESLSALSPSDMLGSLGSRMMEADTSSSIKDTELVDSGVDEELEPPDEEAVFSDPDEEDEGDMTPCKSESTKEKDYEFKPIEKEGMDENEEGDSNEDITELEDLENLGDELKELVIKFSQESDPAVRCNIMESVLNSIVSLDDFEDDAAKSLAVCLNFCLIDDLIIPCIFKDRNLEDCLDGPIYVLCRNICVLPTHDVGRERYLTLLGALHTVDQKVGYRFLFFLKASVSDDERLTMYEDFANTFRGEKTLQACLSEDLKVCQDYDIRAFRYIISSIYKKFPEYVVGNSEVLHLLVGNMEPRQGKGIGNGQGGWSEFFFLSLLEDPLTSPCPEPRAATVTVRNSGSEWFAILRVFWDTRPDSGEGDEDRLRPLSYRGTDVFVVCFDVAIELISKRDGEVDSRLRHYVPEVPVLLLATKTDLRVGNYCTASIVSAKEGKDLATSLGVNVFIRRLQLPDR
ncbi:Integrator complex subunit 3 [Desmophyllum pertusum]|uniref:Integrator complex subunit 3 n=1 Tax=Desmophyllum pertusum TaxID=174260 RepID=A0A9X0CMQ2_9CNID|nr:Integrator complex subunit 3 [Desmophyllum pertusum]